MRLCECCEEHEYQWRLIYAFDKSEYLMCSNCLISLVNNDLTKEQFFALLGAGHSIREYLLHDDFYDPETGEALQPR